jgi:hypothetical protein
MNTGNKNCSLPALGLIAALSLSAGAALADPPGRVARLAYVNGAVSLAPSGSNDWVEAGVNRPLMPGDRVWADPGGRDEVQIGSAALRMDGGTLVSVLNLDDRTAQFQLTQGRAYLRVSRLDPGQVMEVDTPNLALSIRKPGVYRLEVDPDGGATVVTVRSGQAEAYGDGNAYLIDPGQSYRFAGTNLQDYQYAQVPPNDDFERWAAERDRRRENAVARRYVSPDLIGYEDLDDNGSWRNVPNYGNVWIPSHVAPDWAPYRDGHWAWVDPWGWTWVDDAPWGFAVSHYGRWTHLDAGWGWVPGPPQVRPVYAPALVAFVGVALALDANRGPGVAWFPLGPREVYRPSYRASPRYVTNVNVTNTVINRTEITKVVNVTNVTNINYMNRRVPGAVTAVPAQAFVHAQPVRQAAVQLNRQQLASAPVTSKLALAPQADSRGGGQRAHGAPAAAAMARQVLAHTAPLAAAVPRAAPPRGMTRPETVALAAAAPQVKVVHQPRMGKPLAAPPPPRAMAAAPAPSRPAAQQMARGEVARPPQPGAALQAQHTDAGPRVPPQRVEQLPHLPPPHAEVARPPQQAAQLEVQHPPVAARQEVQQQRPGMRAEVPHPPAVAHQEAQHMPPQAMARQDAQHLPPQPIARQEPPHPAPQAIARQEPPRPQPQPIARQEAPHPAPQAIARQEPPHPQPIARQEAPHPAPQAIARQEPPHPQPQPPHEPPRQLAMAKPAEPPHHVQPPPEAHRPPPAPPAEAHHPQQPAPQPHPPAAKPDKNDHKDKHDN